MAGRSFCRVLLFGLLIAAVACGHLRLWAQGAGSTGAARQAGGGETGRYFALVIGIEKYPAPMRQLHTAAGDANSIADLLRKQFGFQVKVLTDPDATRARILDQLASFEHQLTADDNLLIYYAGHGFRMQADDESFAKSFWLPVDATSELSSNRISSDDVTTEMHFSKARHVLLISDSCYSGGFTRNLESLPAIGPDEAFLRKTLAMRSRNIMASGRDEPVADGGPEGHSVFAWAVLHALADQPGSLFTASSLFYGGVQRAVAGNSEQIPVYQPIRDSGDIGGDFVFRRVTANKAEVKTGLAAAATGYDRAVAFYSSGDFVHAAAAFSENCDRGDFRSCSRLGAMYERGRGVLQDSPRAVALFRKGCGGGDALGCNNLGAAYDNGTGVTQDYAQAAALYRKGCDGGEALGCSNLGFMYDRGRGLNQDDAQAVALYRRACDGGDAEGCANLGTVYTFGKGVTQDNAHGVALFRRACDGGSASGCSDLGSMYENAKGVMQDYAQAMALYLKACDGGYAQGCSGVGYLYGVGKGVIQDYAQAVALSRKGCDGGDATGCSNLKLFKEQGHVP